MAISLVVWVIGTWLIGILILNAAHRSGAGRLAQQVRTTDEGHLIGEVAIFFFHIGIPFVAIIVGVLGTDLMALGNALPNTVLGFAALEWVRGVGIAVGTLLFVMLVLWLMSRGQSAVHTSKSTWATALREAAYNEVHWAFYRSAGALWFGDLYAGAVLGSVLIGLEWVLHPHFRAQVQSAEMRPKLVLQLICLIVSSGLYLGVQNLWLMMAAHVLISVIGSRFLSARTTDTAAATPLNSSQPLT